MAFKTALGGILAARFLMTPLTELMGHFLPADSIVKSPGKCIRAVAVGALAFRGILFGQRVLFVVKGYSADAVGEYENLIRLRL